VVEIDVGEPKFFFLFFFYFCLNIKQFFLRGKSITHKVAAAGAFEKKVKQKKRITKIVKNI
jgi:hypothetical protein